jgi:hypothetical protein
MGPVRFTSSVRLPVFVGDVADGAAEPDAGVRHEHVEPTERRDGGGDRLGDVGRVGGVTRDRETLHLRCHRLDGLRTPARHHHGCPFARKQPGGRRADPGPAAADERHLAVEPHPCPLVPCLSFRPASRR